MGGHYAAESVVSLQRNEWSLCGGIRTRMHDPIGEVGGWLQQVIRATTDTMPYPATVRYEHVPNGDYPLLVQDAEASRPKAANQLGTIQTYRQEMDPFTHNPASIPERALLRQTPKIGARCGNSARRDL